jgi:hypothetical protein
MASRTVAEFSQVHSSNKPGPSQAPAIVNLGGAHVPIRPSCSSPPSDHEDSRRRPAKRQTKELATY